MKPADFDWYWMEDVHRPGRARTEKEFKASLRKAALAGGYWSEVGRYADWAQEQRKDSLFSLRFSSTDLMKLKALARMKGAKCRTYVRDILKRHIHAEEERLATRKVKRLARRGRQAD